MRVKCFNTTLVKVLLSMFNPMQLMQMSFNTTLVKVLFTIDRIDEDGD